MAQPPARDERRQSPALSQSKLSIQQPLHGNAGLDPADPFVQPYDTLVLKLEEFYAPTPLKIAENYRFHQWKQCEGESVQQFVAALHKLSIHCKFGEYLRTALRNQFVFGLLNKKAQTHLLERKDLDFDNAVKIAITMELSEKSSMQMKEAGPSSSNLDLLKAGKKPPKKNPSDKRYKGDKYYKNKYAIQNTNQNSKINLKNNNSNIRCYCCGKAHLANKCSLSRDILCHSCGKPGHLSTMCFSKGSAYQLQEILSLEHVNHRDKFLVTLLVNDKPMEFEVDSGAAVTIISTHDVNKVFPGATIHKTQLQLISYCGRVLRSQGFITVNVKYKNKSNQLNLYIVGSSRKPLLGREWIRQLSDGSEFLASSATIDNILMFVPNSKLQNIIEKYNNTRPSEYTAIKGVQAKISLKSDAVPGELDKLENTAIIEKVTTSKWATPIVPILKKNGKIRICGDYKITLNSQLLVDDHPFLTINELFAKLANGKKFSKLDLEQAYLQLEIAPEDRKLLTISTCKGLYKVNRLMYGIASGPTIWQREIENILQGIPGVAIFFDHIVITGETNMIHLAKLEEVLERLNRYNVRLNVDKSTFFSDKVNYCGYVIDKNGVHKEEQKMEAIRQMPRPTNISEVRAFTGMINYYGRFIQNLSAILFPLNKLLRKDIPFIWSKECEAAFCRAKEMFTSKQVLVHFDSRLPLVLATDANHRPLVQIFSPTASLPIYTAIRMQHYAIFLQGVNYEIQYRKSEKHANADCLSRLPVPIQKATVDTVDIFQMETINTLPITAAQIAEKTIKDRELKELLQALQTGIQINKIKRFNVEQLEFSLQNGVIMWGHKVIIPKVLRTKILQELHSGHFGVVKMKSLARGYCWWQGMDKDIETLAKNCANCNTHKNNPPKIEVHHWHKLTSPYNPATNGQAERFVQTLKQSLKRMNCNPRNVNVALNQLLLQYRSMAHAFTNKSLAEMFLGRKLYTRLDLIRPIEENKANKNTTEKVFKNKERVAYRNYSGAPEANEGNQNNDPLAEIIQPPNEIQIDASAPQQAEQPQQNEQRQEAEPIQQTPRCSSRPKEGRDTWLNL
ncbi:uncharacterized protein K02A2.6-like [Nylanderia fulva]|uniref:uncharacterized protein K02A2.6-like n=1 Tax=Nylanderia fulva TaxID=613905 RepID=UPI0010FBA51B|nr:uncharacterized protein K02A2.6-like [Nylanderia fulva]